MIRAYKHRVCEHEPAGIRGAPTENRCAKPQTARESRQKDDRLKGRDEQVRIRQKTGQHGLGFRRCADPRLEDQREAGHAAMNLPADAT